MFTVIIDTCMYLYIRTVVQLYYNYEKDHNYKCFNFFFFHFFRMKEVFVTSKEIKCKYAHDNWIISILEEKNICRIFKYM